MEAFEVIGSLRAQVLGLTQRVKAVEASQEQLERFTWNLVQYLLDGHPVEITLVDPTDVEVEPEYGTPIYDSTLLDLLPTAQEGVGPAGPVT